MISQRLLGLLACPRCRASLDPLQDGGWLACRADDIAFPVEDGIVRLVRAAARPLAEISSAGPASQGDTSSSTP